MARATDNRPDPESLLRQAQAEEEYERRGRLKIFLGYSSGVGKSFRMLDEGRRRCARGQDVVVGATQPIVSPDTVEVLRCLEAIPLRIVDGVATMDVEAILERRPRTCLVDGLAYDNPAGSRNRHRWQDVEDLLNAGISVIGTINLQYIEEYRERAELLTGKHVSQTVPQEFLLSADEIAVVDAPAEQSTLAGDCDKASELREMALVLAANVVDRQLESYLERNGVASQWGAQERILVCLTPRANAAKMLDSGRLTAERFHGELYAAYVTQEEITPEDSAALERNLALAREAGAKVEMLDCGDVAQGILTFARAQGITQILVGHSKRKIWFGRWSGSPVDVLLDEAEDMDVRVFPQ